MANKNNVRQKEKLFQDLESRIDKMNTSLDSLKESIDMIQMGDGISPYWNGNNACSVLKSLTTQYDANKALIQYIIECKGSAKNR